MSTAATPSQNWTRLLTGEIGLAVGAVALFTLFVLGLLRWYFPEGTAIQSVDAGNQGIGVTERGAAIGFGSAGSAGEPLRVGTLTVRKNAVQSRSAQDVDWRGADRGDVFHDRDALQTGPASYAVVQTEDGAEVKLGAQSLVVFEGTGARFAADYSRPIAIVMRGELSGQVSAGTGTSEQVVRINGGALTLMPDAEAASLYSVRVNENDSATISVFRGQAQYSSADGITAIGQRQSLTVDERGNRVALVALPKAPALVSPAAGARIDGRGGLTAVDFAWQPVSGVEGYRIVIARDRELVDRVVDVQVAETRFHHGGLPVGEYYWSVQGRIGWTLGDLDGPRRLSLAADVRPPELVLDGTPAAVSERSVTISGRTDPQARVYVAGQPADNLQGNFKHVTQLAAGANVIVVESVDSVGNVAYASVMVVAK